MPPTCLCKIYLRQQINHNCQNGGIKPLLAVVVCLSLYLLAGAKVIKNHNHSTMRKSEIFADILKTISDETEIAPDLILSRQKDEELVDARHLFIYFLRRNGFYPRMISAKTGLSVRNVNRILGNIESRVASSCEFRYLFNRLSVIYKMG